MMPKVGEVYMLDLGFEGKTRPIVIVSREDADAPRALSVFVPLTKESRGGNYEVRMPRVPWLKLQSYANVLGLGAVEWHELTDRRGRFEAGTVGQIRDAIRWVLEL
jgi:mRNA-degrading endonuclease toxin of MazEF toxin-antitoxin module